MINADDASEGMPPPPTGVGRVVKMLTPHTTAVDVWAMIAPDVAPAFVGNAQSGTDWCCPRCNAILVEAAYEAQFLDVLFRCPGCGEIGASPIRQAGQPLAGRPLLTPPGRYRLGSAVDLTNKPVMMVGQQALEGYLAETGRLPAGASPQALPTTLTPTSLRQLAAQAKGLLGARYSPLLAADRRGLASATPPPQRHRLVELIAFAEDTAAVLETSDGATRVEVGGDRLSELVATVALFDRWRNHPAWPELVRSLVTPAEAQHAVMLLVTASYLVDAGNGVGIVTQDSSGRRIADLWVDPSLAERLHLEVKTPQALRGPRVTALELTEAEALVETLINKAASTARGQLDPRHPGMLAIGGFHLGPGGLDLLADAGRRVLERQARQGRKRHLAALVVSELSYEATAAGFSTMLNRRLIRHPGYAGALTIDENSQPWQTNQLAE
jgi:hypothetical protein